MYQRGGSGSNPRMHRAYQPLLPTHNKLLQKRWDDKYYSEHRDKVRGANPMVDTKPPPTYMHLHLKLKKLQLEEERLAQVERDNRILLEKMAHIMRTRGRVDNINPYQYKSLNKEKRQRELVRVTQENQALLARVLSRKPEYSVQRYRSEWSEVIKFMDNIACYPVDWYQDYLARVRRLGTSELDSDAESEKPEDLAPLPPRTLSALPKKSRRSAGSVSARSQDSGHMSGRGDSDDESSPKQELNPPEDKENKSESSSTEADPSELDKGVVGNGEAKGVEAGNGETAFEDDDDDDDGEEEDEDDDDDDEEEDEDDDNYDYSDDDDDVTLTTTKEENENTTTTTDTARTSDTDASAAAKSDLDATPRSTA